MEEVLHIQRQEPMQDRSTDRDDIGNSSRQHPSTHSDPVGPPPRPSSAADNYPMLGSVDYRGALPSQTETNARRLGQTNSRDPRSWSHPQNPPSQSQPLRLPKLSSSSSNGGTGYHPSDRIVLVNDYAVPTKRSGDTPPDHPSLRSNGYDAQHAYHSYASDPSRQHRHQPAPPPTSALPPLPTHNPSTLPQQHAPYSQMEVATQQPQHQQQQQQPPPPQRKTVGTVVVKGKTYTRMGLLGKGGSSKVFRVCERDTQQIYALKKVDLGKGVDAETYQSFLNEINLLERLKEHNRIIKLFNYEVNEVKKSLIMIMEIGEIDLNQLLQERLSSNNYKISMNFIRHTWEQMLEAVNVIHEEGIVHTDLKPANFVLVKGSLKLIDFGIAKAIPNDTTNIARDQQVRALRY